MKILHVNHSDSSGGAARAAYRLHQSLRKIGIESRMLVNIANLGDWTVIGPQNKLDKLLNILRPHFAALLLKVFRTKNKILHSLALLYSGKLKKINRGDVDLIHLHWINGEMLSIREIGRINKPVVWTLHDMWAFCGAEHVSYDARWEEGYSDANRDNEEFGLDINKWVWKRKLKNWKKPMHIVAPSNWMASCVKKSKLLKGWPVTVIQNPIDTKTWAPIERGLARSILGLDEYSDSIILFGAMGDIYAHHKGYDLLREALEKLSTKGGGVKLVIYGQMAPENEERFGIPVKFLGHLCDDIALRLAYSAADLIVVPSRIDNFPSAATEAMSCGTPVVAFKVCGLTDIVEHKKDGYLAEPFNPLDLAEGIQWVLSNNNNNSLGIAARAKAVKLWDNEIIANIYKELYKNILEK
jgi:glycosyltransferase involved in cell wall biosynthesis